MLVAAVDAPAWDCHGRVAVCACHCAVGQLVAEVARSSSGDLWRVGGEWRGWRVELVREGSVLEMWWGLLVGSISDVWQVGRRERSHGEYVW